MGQRFDEPTQITAIGLRPDNGVYGISDIYVEYLDEVTGEWMIRTTLKNVPKHYGDINSGGPTYPNDEWYTVALAEPRSTKWRIRNAGKPASNAWALRGLRFCEDAKCEHVASGEVFDDGSAPNWGSAAALFDDDASNFWKAFNGPKAGQAFVGLEFKKPTHVAAIGIRPDNRVYGISEVFVEYLDSNSGKWVTHDLLTNVPKHYSQIQSGGPTYPNNVWYTAILSTPSP